MHRCTSGASGFQENADGRNMIDLGSFSKMNLDYPMGSAKPSTQFQRDNIVTKINITLDPDYIFAPSFIYGFSFTFEAMEMFLCVENFIYRIQQPGIW